MSKKKRPHVAIEEKCKYNHTCTQKKTKIQEPFVVGIPIVGLPCLGFGAFPVLELHSATFLYSCLSPDK